MTRPRRTHCADCGAELTDANCDRRGDGAWFRYRCRACMKARRPSKAKPAAPCTWCGAPVPPRRASRSRPGLCPACRSAAELEADQAERAARPRPAPDPAELERAGHLRAVQLAAEASRAAREAADQALKAEVRAAVAAGVTLSAVGRAAGITRDTVRVWVAAGSGHAETAPTSE